jgi:hypothetical protein
MGLVSLKLAAVVDHFNASPIQHKCFSELNLWCFCLACSVWKLYHRFSSTPTCTPARAAILTGQSPWNHGMLGYGAVAPVYPFEMPVALAALGYAFFSHLSPPHSRKVETEGGLLICFAWVSPEYGFPTCSVTPRRQSARTTLAGTPAGTCLHSTLKQTLAMLGLERHTATSKLPAGFRWRQISRYTTKLRGRVTTNVS